MKHFWIGYARSGKEFEVRDAILALGIDATVPRQVEAKRQGKRRYPDAVVTPALPNYVFIDTSDDDWHKLRDVKFLAATLVRVSDRSLAGKQGPRAYLEANAADFEARMDKIEAGQRVEEYQPGEALQIYAGAFAGQLARFRRVVERAHEPFPQIEAEGELFGQIVRFNVDPIYARKVG